MKNSETKNITIYVVAKRYGVDLEDPCVFRTEKEAREDAFDYVFSGVCDEFGDSVEEMAEEKGKEFSDLTPEEVAELADECGFSFDCGENSFCYYGDDESYEAKIKEITL